MNFDTGIFSWGSWKNAFFIPKPCAVKFDGTVDYYLNPENFNQKEDGTPSDITNMDYQGNFMMEFPKIFISFYSEDNWIYVFIANKKIDLDFDCWACKESTGFYVDHFYLPMFEGTVDNNVDIRLRSIATSTVPTGNTVVSTESLYARNNGLGWDNTTWAQEQAVQLLFPLLFRSMNGSEKLGLGATATGLSALSSINNSLLDKGLMFGTKARDNRGLVYLGMHNWWGHRYRRFKGLINDHGKILFKMTQSKIDGSTTLGFNRTGEGYIDSGLTVSNVQGNIGKFETYKNMALIPIEGMSSCYFHDRLETNTVGVYIPFTGFCQNIDSGIFSLSMDDLENDTWFWCGSSISYTPSNLYQPIECIKLENRQALDYFDTEVPIDDTIKIVIDFKPNVVTGNMLFGGKSSADIENWRVFSYDNEIYFDIGYEDTNTDCRIHGDVLKKGERYNLEFGNFYAKSYGSSTNLLTGTIRSYTGTQTFKICSLLTLYHLRIYKNNNLIKEYFPIQHKISGKFGLYEREGQVAYFENYMKSVLPPPPVEVIEFPNIDHTVKCAFSVPMIFDDIGTFKDFDCDNSTPITIANEYTPNVVIDQFGILDYSKAVYFYVLLLKQDKSLVSNMKIGGKTKDGYKIIDLTLTNFRAYSLDRYTLKKYYSINMGEQVDLSGQQCRFDVSCEKEFKEVKALVDEILEYGEENPSLDVAVYFSETSLLKNPETPEIEGIFKIVNENKIEAENIVENFNPSPIPLEVAFDIFDSSIKLYGSQGGGRVINSLYVEEVGNTSNNYLGTVLEDAIGSSFVSGSGTDPLINLATGKLEQVVGTDISELFGSYHPHDFSYEDLTAIQNVINTAKTNGHNIKVKFGICNWMKSVCGWNSEKNEYYCERYSVIIGDHSNCDLTVSPTRGLGYSTGDVITIKTTPETGCVMQSVSINGVKQDSLTDISYTIGTKDVTITAVAYECYNLSITNIANCTISTDPAPGLISVGTNVKVTATPSSGYNLDWIKYNTTTINNGSSFTMPHSDVVITASVSQQSNLPTAQKTNFTVVSQYGRGFYFCAPDGYNFGTLKITTSTGQTFGSGSAFSYTGSLYSYGTYFQFTSTGSTKTVNLNDFKFYVADKNTIVGLGIGDPIGTATSGAIEPVTVKSGLVTK